MPAGSPSRLRTGRRYEKETADPRQNRPGAESALGAAALVMTARENPQGPRRNARRSTLGYKERPILTHARGRMGHGPALARDDNRDPHATTACGAPAKPGAGCRLEALRGSGQAGATKKKQQIPGKIVRGPRARLALWRSG